jgi:hypothetical protein
MVTIRGFDQPIYACEVEWRQVPSLRSTESSEGP